MEHVLPFLKWAGGKSKLLGEITKRLPKKWSGSYFEPFVGGGAVFFFFKSTAKQRFNAYLSDTNEELINAYASVAIAPDKIIALLRTHENNHSKKHYYWVRDELKAQTQLTRAARFIYLNRTCFNGLYRVNKAGKFNVPMGDYKKPVICNVLGIQHASNVLDNTKVTAQIFHEAIAGAMRGDFIYCDPPYLPKSDTAEFTSYTSEGFTLGDHEQLRAELARADKRGAKWMLSEGDSTFIRKLFKGYNIMPVKSRHSVAASGDSREVSKELLITNYREFKPWHAVG